MEYQVSLLERIILQIKLCLAFGIQLEIKLFLEKILIKLTGNIISVSYSNKKLKLFYNGTLTDSSTGDYVQNNQNIFLGCLQIYQNNSPEIFFEGKINDIDIWNRAEFCKFAAVMIQPDQITSLDDRLDALRRHL
jgi:hypothetical protein